MSRTSVHYEPFEEPGMHLQYSYENFQDNPIMKDRRRISRQAKNKVEYTMPNKINKPRAVPPRSSIEPIPTPRKSSAYRSREQSREKEPYYKQPPSNKPVHVKQNTSREPVHLHYDKARKRQRPHQAAYSSSSGSDSQTEQSDTYAVINYSDKHHQAAKKGNHSSKSELRGEKAAIQRKVTPRHKQQESQSRRSSKYSEFSDDSEYEKISKKPSRPEKSPVRQAAIADSKIKSKNNTKTTNDCRIKHSVKKQESEESKKSREVQSSKIPVLQAKTKQSKSAQERFPKKTNEERERNKSKQGPEKRSPDVLAKINHGKQHYSSRPARSEISISSTKAKNPPVAAAAATKARNPPVAEAAVKRDLGGLSTYTPMEIPLQRPDWFEEAAASKPKEPRPKSIVDGVLYTSR